MNRIERIKEALSILNPDHLEILDETHMHYGHAGHNPNSEYTHLKIIISDNFGDIGLVEKHRKINNLLKEEFSNGLHAASISMTTSRH